MKVRHPNRSRTKPRQHPRAPERYEIGDRAPYDAHEVPGGKRQAGSHCECARATDDRVDDNGNRRGRAEPQQSTQRVTVHDGLLGRLHRPQGPELKNGDGR